MFNQDCKNVCTHLDLPQIISLDQTGFIHQKQTQDNIRMTLHVFSHITKYNLEVVLVGLDAETV